MGLAVGELYLSYRVAGGDERPGQEKHKPYSTLVLHKKSNANQNMSCKALQEKNLKTQIAFRNDLVFNNDVFNIFLFKFMHYILFFLVEKV